MSTRVPPCKWAERNDRVYLTIDVQDVDPSTAKVALEENGKLTFSYKDFSLDVELLKEVNVEKSKWAVAPRGVAFDIIKKEEGYWNKLFKVPSSKPAWLQVDWSRWKDEDDDDDKPAMDMDLGANGFNFGDMMGQGMPNMDGLPEGDSDDEDMPDLEGDETTAAAAAATEEPKKKEKEEEEEKKPE